MTLDRDQIKRDAEAVIDEFALDAEGPAIRTARHCLALLTELDTAEGNATRNARVMNELRKDLTAAQDHLRSEERLHRATEHRLEQAEREKLRIHTAYVDDSQAWAKRCRAAEHRLAKTPALVEALKRIESEDGHGENPAPVIVARIRMIAREALIAWEQNT